MQWRVVQYTRTVTVRISHVSIRTDRTDRQQGYTFCKVCFTVRKSHGHDWCSDMQRMYKKCDTRAKLLSCKSKRIAFLPFSLPSPSLLFKLPIGCYEDAKETGSKLVSSPVRTDVTLGSLRNRTAGRRGRQNVCVWQTWQGYYLHVMSWSSLSVNNFLFLQKDLFKGKWCLAKSYFKQNCCHGCHTRFAVFFPLPSCCVSSLLGSVSNKDGDRYENVT